MHHTNVTNYNNHYTPLTNFTAQKDIRGLFKHLTISRTMNTIGSIVTWKTHLPRSDFLPIVVQVESSVLCNLHCPKCSTPRRGLDGSPVYLTETLLDKLLRTIAKSTLMVKLHALGEPMTNPNIFRLVSLAHKYDLYTSFSTNGTLFTEHHIRGALSSGLDLISICLDGFTQESYSKHRVGGDVNKLKCSIRELSELKGQLSSKTPFVNVFVISFNDVRPEIPAIDRFCRENNVDMMTVRADQWNVDGSHRNIVVSKPRKKCMFPWTWAVMDQDGNVYSCPHMYYTGNRTFYGNVRDTEFTEIWNNSLFQETRNYLSGRVAIKHHLDLPCYSCDAFH
jgi:radical SAM protein with 4Fe4S-binding SPASM domain